MASHTCWITRTMIVSFFLGLIVIVGSAFWLVLTYAQGRYDALDVRVRDNQVMLGAIKTISEDIKEIKSDIKEYIRP